MKNLFKKSLLVLIGVLLTSLTTQMWADVDDTKTIFFDITGCSWYLNESYVPRVQVCKTNDDLTNEGASGGNLYSHDYDEEIRTGVYRFEIAKEAKWVKFYRYKNGDWQNLSSRIWINSSDANSACCYEYHNYFVKNADGNEVSEANMSSTHSTGGEAYFYAENLTTRTHVAICLGRWNNTKVEAMSLVSNTEKLYYSNQLAYSPAHAYTAIIGTTSAWSGGSWGTANLPSAADNTRAKYGYEFNNGSVYYLTKSSTTKGDPLNISHMANGTADIPKYNTKVQVKVKESGAAGYSNGSTSDKPATTIRLRGTYLSGSGASARSYETWSSGSETSDYASVISGKVTPSFKSKSDNWQFDGWYIESTQKSLADSFDIYQGTSSVVVEARFTRIKYPVTLDREGGSGGSGSATATYGSAMPSITSPTTDRSGYTFDGYYSGRGGSGNKYYNAGGSSARNSDINNPSGTTLYAKWKQTVVLEGNGGSEDGSVDAVYYAEGPLSPSAPTYSGHIVDGYNALDGTAVLTAAGAFAASNVTDESSVAYISSSKWVHAGATTLYAHWKCDAPVITCTDNVVTMTVPSGATVYYTTNGTAPTSSSTAYDPSNKPTIAANTTFNAIAIQSGCTNSDVTTYSATYTPVYSVTINTLNSRKESGDASVLQNKSYMATFSDVDGYNLPSTVTVTIGGVTKTVSTDYTWNQGTGTLEILANKINGNVVITVTGVEETYNVTLNRNGGDGDNQVIQTTYNSSSLSAAVTTPERSGYTFDGWYAMNGGADGVGDQVINTNGELNSGVTNFTDGSGNWTKTSGTTLYARWKNNANTDKYNFQYGDGAYYGSGWTVASFAQVGSTSEYTIANFTMPNPSTVPYFFVGENEDFVSSGLGINGSKSVKTEMGSIRLAPGTTTAGTITGATGKLVIDEDSDENNLYVGFLPSGYALTYNGGTINLSSTATENIWESNSVTLSAGDVSETFKIRLRTSDSYVDCSLSSTEDDDAINARSVANLTSGLKGKFQIDISSGTTNFGLKFSPVYTVRFDRNGHGETPSDITDVAYNSKISSPGDLTAEGYIFGGWYKEAGCTNEWNFSTDVVTEATTLYAKWTDDGIYYFDGGADGSSTAWGTAANWTKGNTPTETSVVRLLKEAEISSGTVHVARIDVVTGGACTTRGNSYTAAGKLVIGAGAKLIVTDSIARVADAAEINTRTSTRSEDVLIGSSASGNGALAMGNYKGKDKATVYFYTKSHGATDNSGSVNQYVGTPFSDANVLYNWYDSWIYKVNDAGTAWQRIQGSDPMYPFEGYNVISNGNAAGHIYEMSGTLVSTDDKIITLKHTNAGEENLLANSWTAPIKINAISASSFVGADATIYIFNSGSPDDWKDNGASTGTSAGQYQTSPVNSPATGYNTIPSLQSFSVYANDKSETHTLTLDYSAIVYDVLNSQSIEPNHAPRRTMGEEEQPDEVILTIRGNSGWGDDVRILVREDFTNGFDNGWDGRKMYGVAEAPSFYVQSTDGEMAVAAVPDFNDAVLGFKAGTEDNDYTFTFTYNGDKPLYLYDMQTESQTPIDNETSYSFTASDKNAHNRFVIRRVSQVTTDIEMLQGADEQNAVKFLEKGQLFILHGGRIYDATGAVVK